LGLGNRERGKKGGKGGKKNKQQGVVNVGVL